MDFVNPKQFHFAGCTLDLVRGALARGGDEIVLRPKSYEVLRYFVQNPGRLITKDELIAGVWSNIAVTDDSLFHCIKEIREAIGDRDHRLIQTRPRRGYLFAAEVSALPVSARADESSAAPELAAISVPQAGSGGARRPGLIAAAAILLLLAGAAALILSARTPPPAADAEAATPAPVRMRDLKPAIAVLPFVSLTGAAEDYFAGGLTDDIISALGRFTELSVRSRGATLRFQDKILRPEEIARELNVRYVIEGSVRRNPGRVRISVRLTDAPHGAVLWSQQYDVPPDAIFAVQDDITRQIAGNLAVRLKDWELARIAGKPPASLEAYDLVLRGRAALWRDIRGSNFEARTLFEAALALDPDYIPALIGLGLVESQAISQGWSADPGEALRRAERLGERAVALDETHPGGHQLLGRVYSWRGDFERALDAIRRAIELNPSDLNSYLTLAKPLLWSGDLDGAIAALETAWRLGADTTVFFAVHLGTAYVVAERSADAIRVLERAVARDRADPFTRALLAAAYAEAGRMEEAAREAGTVRHLAPFLPTGELGSLFRNPEHRQKLAAALQKAGF